MLHNKDVDAFHININKFWKTFLKASVTCIQKNCFTAVFAPSLSQEIASCMEHLCAAPRIDQCQKEIRCLALDWIPAYNHLLQRSAGTVTEWFSSTWHIVHSLSWAGYGFQHATSSCHIHTAQQLSLFPLPMISKQDCSSWLLCIWFLAYVNFLLELCQRHLSI